MAWTPISGTVPQYSTDANTLASDYWLKFYKSGTTTPFSVAIDSAGTSPQAKVKLNTSGYPISNPLDETTIFIPHVDQAYRIVLYKSEADADANNTANAAFNIDGMPLNISPILENAVAIDMRNTTLLIQDDYDRSPKFIDGNGFTAGAGPHVITAPAGWTPTDADMRFYKVSSGGIVTPLTPTAKTATTFTIPDTLLSTDIVFIGDDEFRDQLDSDPLFIRNQLSVYSKAESDAAFLEDGTGTVSNTNLATDSVSTVKIQNDAVTNDKIAPSAVDTTELADGAVTSNKLERSILFGGDYLFRPYPSGTELQTTSTAYDAVTFPDTTNYTSQNSIAFTVHAPSSEFTVLLNQRSISGTSSVRVVKNGVQQQEFTTTSSTNVLRAFDYITVASGDVIVVQQKSSVGGTTAMNGIGISMAFDGAIYGAVSVRFA